MLPTLDEARGLEAVAENIPHEKMKEMGWNCQVWVVDGGSNDDTKASRSEKSISIHTSTRERQRSSNETRVFKVP